MVVFEHCQELNELWHEPAFDSLTCIIYFEVMDCQTCLAGDAMTLLSYFFKVRHLILAAALTTGPSFVNHANAQPLGAFLVDLNSRSATEIDPGTLGNPYYVSGINDAGQVVGVSSTAGGSDHAFITGPDGVGMRDLGTLSGTYSWASDINNVGQVVGRADTTDVHSHAFITGPDGMGMRDLGTLGKYFSSANGINDAGQVVGVSDTIGGFYHGAFITGPDGVGMRGLGTLGGTSSVAYDLNDAGQVVGDSYTTGPYSHAFITGPDGMGMRDLGTLGESSSAAYGLNNAGQVVGVSETTGGLGHAFITGPDGVGMRDLGTLGGNISVAFDINDAGQVVGWSETTTEGGTHAFVTGPDGEGMVDLNSLVVDLPDGIILTRADGINNNGQVIAIGVFPVIPEPETYALMLAGLSLIGLMSGARSRRTRTREPGERLGQS